MYFTQEVKQYLSMASTLQLLKLLKFINVFIPKMALATSVLSHGLVDLGMFTLFFFFFIFACAQLFFIQLGPYLDSYNNITSAFVTLFRALFGDFDLTAIMDNSSSYTNAILLILYLFAAIFVLLSIFLTILGEHQSHVRDVQARTAQCPNAPMNQRPNALMPQCPNGPTVRWPNAPLLTCAAPREGEGLG